MVLKRGFKKRNGGKRRGGREGESIGGSKNKKRNCASYEEKRKRGATKKGRCGDVM